MCAEHGIPGTRLGVHRVGPGVNGTVQEGRALPSSVPVDLGGILTMVGKHLLGANGSFPFCFFNTRSYINIKFKASLAILELQAQTSTS